MTSTRGKSPAERQARRSGARPLPGRRTIRRPVRGAGSPPPRPSACPRSARSTARRENYPAAQFRLRSLKEAESVGEEAFSAAHQAGLRMSAEQALALPKDRSWPPMTQADYRTVTREVYRPVTRAVTASQRLCNRTHWPRGRGGLTSEGGRPGRGLCPAAGDVPGQPPRRTCPVRRGGQRAGPSCGIVCGYFSPVPVFSTTTWSASASHPDSRNWRTAVTQAAPSGQMKQPSRCAIRR